jgi:CelD/BcsL family acetyltransferase involved in cellulose biosynthesis
MSTDSSAGRPLSLSFSEDIDLVLAEWGDGPHAASAGIDLTASPLALRAWSRNFGQRVSLLQLSHGGALRALWPLLRKNHPLRTGALRRWSSPANYYWQFGYPMGGTGTLESATAALGLLAQRRDWDVLELGPMLASPPLHAIQAQARRLGMRPQVYARKLDPIVVVAGAWEPYYQARSASLRDKIQRGERQLARDGQLTLQEYTGGSDLEQRLDEFLQLEACGWKGRQGTAIASDPATRAFYIDLARESAERGWLRLFLLRAGDTLIACDYCIARDNTVHVLKIAYDEKRSRHSPGHVMRKLVLQRMFGQHQPMIYDLMTGGGEHGDYKLRWASEVREYAMLRLFNPATVRGRLFHALVVARQAMARIRARARNR